jgi:hypothetical protein
LRFILQRNHSMIFCFLNKQKIKKKNPPSYR